MRIAPRVSPMAQLSPQHLRWRSTLSLTHAWSRNRITILKHKEAYLHRHWRYEHPLSRAANHRLSEGREVRGPRGPRTRPDPPTLRADRMELELLRLLAEPRHSDWYCGGAASRSRYDGARLTAGEGCGTTMLVGPGSLRRYAGAGMVEGPGTSSRSRYDGARLTAGGISGIGELEGGSQAR